MKTKLTKEVVTKISVQQDPISVYSIIWSNFHKESFLRKDLKYTL